MTVVPWKTPGFAITILLLVVAKCRSDDSASGSRNRHVRPTVRVFPADYISMMDKQQQSPRRNLDNVTTPCKLCGKPKLTPAAFELPAPGKRAPATKPKPPSVKKRPVALPQKGFNRPSRFSSKLPALHPHQIKEMPRSPVAPSSAVKPVSSPNNPISHIINKHHDVTPSSNMQQATYTMQKELDQAKSKSSSSSVLPPPNAQPYSFDEYYYYDDYDYYEDLPPRPTRPPPPPPKAPKRKTPSTLYPTYKRAPSSKYSKNQSNYRRPISKSPPPPPPVSQSNSYNYRKRPTAAPPSNSNRNIVKKSGYRTPTISSSSSHHQGRADYNNRSGYKPAVPTVQSSATRYYEQSSSSSSSSNSRIDDYYDDEDDYYFEYYEDYDAAPRRRSGQGRPRSDSYGGGGGLNPLALLVAPLAGISLLTAAAAVALNPVLVSVSLTKRKKRSVFDGLDEDGASNSTDNSLDPQVREKIHEMEVLEKFLGSVPSQIKYQQQILSMYLSCSGYLEDSNQCLDRVVCEYSDKTSSLQEDERDVVAIVLFNIMGNEFVGEEYKARLRESAKIGRDGQQSCHARYPCYQLDDIKTKTHSNLTGAEETKKTPKKNF